MKGLTVFLAALLLAVNLIAAPDEGGADELQSEVFDLEFALPEFAIPELELLSLPMMEEHEYARQMQDEMISEIEEAAPRFLVFVNVENVAYLWYWDECDKEDPSVPINHKTRFRKRKL